METVVFASHLPGPRLRHRILHVVSERADMSNALRHPSKTLFPLSPACDLHQNLIPPLITALTQCAERLRQGLSVSRQSGRGLSPAKDDA